jgi:hypothetical protein
MSKSRTTLIAALAVASLLVAAPALAAKGDVRVSTTDSDPGGEAYMVHEDGEVVLKACDIQKDGHSVWAYASYHKYLQNTTADTNGANNGCHANPLKVSKGRRVYVKVCLADQGGANVRVHCSGWKKGRA